MAKACPYCRQGDIAEDAVKCQHCGSWLSEAKKLDEYEAFRVDIRKQVGDDLEKHRALIEKLLTRMQIFAGVIAAVAGGFAVYFTGVTKENITQTSTRIEEAASAQVRNAADQATLKAIETVNESVRDRVAGAVRERLDDPATRKLIEDTLAASVTTSVKGEVGARIETIRAEVAGETDAARQTLAALTSEIEGVRDEALVALDKARNLTENTEAAVVAVSSVKSFAAAEYSQYAAPDADAGGLDFQIIRASGKEGVDQLPELMDRRVNALTFELGSQAYWGPVVWKYVEWLGRNPQFQYVVLVDGSEAAVGYWPVPVLAAALNPPANGELAGRNADLHDLPGEGEIGRWEEFAEAVNRGDFDALRALPGFRSMEGAVRSDWSNYQALDHMLQVGADSLPVVDGAGRLVGIADRSQLTTHMLLQIAGRP